MHTLLYAALPLFVGTISVFALGAGGAVSPDVLKDLAPGGTVARGIKRLFAGFWFEHDLCSNGHLSADLDHPIGRNLEIIRRIIG